MGTASKRRFEAFAAAAADTLFRTASLMTGDASEAEDLVQETFIRVARRWPRVATMDHPELFVRLPAGHGMVRDLVIGAKDLSGPALIKIAANGLSS